MLEQVWTTHQSLFRRIVSNILVDAALVDDVLQDTYIRVLRNGRRFEDEQEAFNYLRRSVINTTLDFYRRTCRYGHRFKAAEDLATLPVATSRARDPLELVLLEEDARLRRRLAGRVRRAVKRLPEPQRQAVELVFRKSPDMPLKEVCRRHRIPYSTLRSRLLRAFELIRSEVAATESEAIEARGACHEM